MPINLGGGLPSLLDPLGLFASRGNNGVGTGARSHPVFGDGGPRGPNQGAGPIHGQGPGQGQGANLNAGGYGRSISAAAPQLPPAPPVPFIHGNGSPVGVVNQVVQQATQALSGPAHGPGLQVPNHSALPQAGMATPMTTAATTSPAVAVPGTIAFTGGPGQPALPATVGHVQGVVSTVTSMPGQVVSQLARAMNHPVPQAQTQSQTHAQAQHLQGQGQMQAHTPAHAQMHAGNLYPAAHRATDTPAMPRAPASAPGTPFAPTATTAPQAAAHRAGVPVAQGQQAPVPAHAQAPAAQSLPGNAAPMSHAAQQPAQVPAQQPTQQPGRTAQAGQATQGNPAAQQPAAANPQAPSCTTSNPAIQAGIANAANQAPVASQATLASQANTAATQAQVAAPLAVALAGSTAVEARPVQPGGAERGPLQLENSQPAGHTAERGVRRPLRSRVEGAGKTLLQMLGLSMLDPAMRRPPEGHTAAGMDGLTGKGLWFALPWMFWLLAVLAYGCLALALIVMAGSASTDAPGGSAGSWVPAMVLGVGLAAGAGAWVIARGWRRRRD